MPIPLSRRAVAAGLVGLAASPVCGSAAEAPCDPRVAALSNNWREARLATERAWLAQTAVTDAIMAHPEERPSFDKHRGLAYWRRIEHICRRSGDREAAHAVMEKALRHPPDVWRGSAYRDFHALANAVGRGIRLTRIAFEAGYPDVVAAVEAAERYEDDLAARILARPPVSRSEADLQALVSRRIADVEPLAPIVGVDPTLKVGEDMVYDPGADALAGGEFSAAEFIRQIERAHYLLLGNDCLFSMYDQEPPDILRRRGRLIACARSIPGIAKELSTFQERRLDRPHLTSRLSSSLKAQEAFRHAARGVANSLCLVYVRETMARLA